MFTRAVLRLLAATGATIALLLTTGGALAKPACPVCGPPEKVTVSGQGLTGVIAVTDPATLRALGTIVFFAWDEPRSAVAAPQVGAGYDLTRYYNAEAGGFDHLRYYPSPAGGPGAIFYVGPTGSGDSRQIAQVVGLDARVGKWYTATPQEDAAVQQLLRAANATGLLSTVPATRATAEPRSTVADAGASLAWLLVLGALGTGGIIGIGTVRWRRRAASRR